MVRESLLEPLLRLPLRQLHMLSAAALLLGALAAWMVLKAPVSALLAARAEHATLVQAAETEQTLRLTSETLSAELARMTASASAAGGVADGGKPDRLVMDALQRFHRLGAEHQVNLNKLAPGTPGRFLMFEEIPFEVEVTGSYANAVTWLMEAERSLPALSIVQFDVNRLDTSASVLLKARLSAYISTESMQ